MAAAIESVGSPASSVGVPLGGLTDTRSIVAAARNLQHMALALGAQGDLLGALDMFARARAGVLQISLTDEPSALAVESRVLAAETYVQSWSPPFVS